MKRPNEKPTESIMRYFTVELFGQLQSDDDLIADQASENWQTAVATYRASLAELVPHLTSSMRKIAKQSFHDVEVRDHYELSIDDSQKLYIIRLKDGEVISTLRYVLAGRVKTNHQPDFPGAGNTIYWLYDEWDMDRKQRLIHRILLSDGTELAIPFSELTQERPKSRKLPTVRRNVLPNMTASIQPPARPTKTKQPAK